MKRTVKVGAAFDEEVGVWYIETSDLAGLSAESKTLEELLARLPGMVADLLEEAGSAPIIGDEVEIELAAHAQINVKLPAAA